MRSKAISLVMLLFWAGASGLSSCSRGEYSGKVETLTIATVPTELNAPLYIAADQDFFTRNGLQVTIKENYDSGATATAGMLNGEADVATASEFVIVRQILNGKDLLNFGTITKYENTFIVWLADRGLKTIQDLKGKKVGVTLKTISEFYLGRTFGLNGLDLKQVTLVDVKAADAERAIAQGEVDAVVTWEPWVTRIDQHRGKEVIISALQSSQQAYWNLVSTGQWAKNRSEIIKRLLKSITQAEGYLARHQAEAKAIVRNRLKFNDAFMERVWPRYQFSLSLDQSLIAAMEDEARWMMSHNLTLEKKMPDFKNYIYVDGLKATKPEAVNIIP
ncbi:MAG: NrtA/SsuA/CpmA family ABC transporter substrate-binding protein [Deltaproteobacteria bacterium]|nr:NrtA/SsuA/CpmA family ABC transporter substrate-binding protein [Deltaproteobacteria bacterium]